MKKTMPALLALLAALAAGPAAAAMYRCGNAFQDRPCEDGAQQRTIRPGRGGAAPVPTVAASAARAASQPARPTAP